MFKIDKDSFIKYYGGEKNGLKCFKSCFGIVLYGAGLENTKASVGILSLSAGANVVVRLTEDYSFKIICSDMDTEFECNLEELKAFNGDKLPKALFKVCAMLKGEIKGAEILIYYSIDDKKFKTPVTALATALGIMDKGKIPDIEAVRFLADESEDEKNLIPAAELYGRKNTILNRRNDGKWEYLSFNFSGVKAVLSYVDKTIDVKKMLSEDDMEKYKSNECKRIELIRAELSENKTITQQIAKIFKASAYELFNMLGKNSDFLFDMYKFSEETNLVTAVVPIYSIGGVCAFVEDKDIDNYIEKLSSEYQKKAGQMPTFCICDSDSSGIISDIESE